MKYAKKITKYMQVSLIDHEYLIERTDVIKEQYKKKSREDHD